MMIMTKEYQYHSRNLEMIDSESFLLPLYPHG